jgi:hypothetical protein
MLTPELMDVVIEHLHNDVHALRPALRACSLARFVLQVVWLAGHLPDKLRFIAGWSGQPADSSGVSAAQRIPTVSKRT